MNDRSYVCSEKTMQYIDVYGVLTMWNLKTVLLESHLSKNRKIVFSFTCHPRIHLMCTENSFASACTKSTDLKENTITRNAKYTGVVLSTL